MEEKKSVAEEVTAMNYDATGVAFDFVDVNNETALVCAFDASIREKVIKALADINFNITEAATDRDALKNMRFNAYDLIVVDENFAVDSKGDNEVLSYLQKLAIATRRKTMVTLLTDNYRTMDNMAAFNKSVNLVVNKKNIDDFASIVKRGLDDNKAFYSVFKETLKKTGRI